MLFKVYISSVCVNRVTGLLLGLVNVCRYVLYRSI